MAGAYQGKGIKASQDFFDINSQLLQLGLLLQTKLTGCADRDHNYKAVIWKLGLSGMQSVPQSMKDLCAMHQALQLS